MSQKRTALELLKEHEAELNAAITRVKGECHEWWVEKNLLRNYRTQLLKVKAAKLLVGLSPDSEVELIEIEER